MTPIVSIVCISYNQELYIKDALESFLMQKTNFDFEIIISDDCSTDNTHAIIKEYCDNYPNIIHDVSPVKNIGAIPNWCYVQELARGKYVAICEGDDYWTDPLKLQKQVDILENNNKFAAVFTDCTIVDSKGEVLKENSGVTDIIDGKTTVTLRDFFNLNPQYPTASVCYRNINREKRIEMYKYLSNQFLADWTSWIVLHTFGNFYFLDEVTCAYRKNPTSITHTSSKVGKAKATFDICNKVADILPEEYSDIAKDIRDTDWNIMFLAHAYRKEYKYFHAFWYTVVSFIKTPSLTIKYFIKVINHKRSRVNGD